MNLYVLFLAGISYVHFSGLYEKAATTPFRQNFFLQLFFVLRDPVNSQIVAYTAMDVIGVQYDDFLFPCKTGKRQQE